MKLALRRAFSLVELMIVIGIIGIFFVVVQQFTQNTNIDQERATRFAELIHDTIRDTRNDMVIGRGVLTGANEDDKTFIPTAQKRLAFSESEFSLQYIPSGGTTLQVETRWEHPFIDHDPLYKIASIQTSTGIVGSDGKLSGGAWDDTPDLILIFDPQGRVSLSGSTISADARTYRIEVEYKQFVRYIVGSAVTGNVDLDQ